MYGLEGDSDLDAAIQDMLDDTLIEFNTYLFEFQREVLSGIVLVDGQAEYELNGTPYRESAAYLVHTDGTKQSPMMYIPYVQFVRDIQNAVAGGSGMSYRYTFRNVDKDGKIRLYPTPDSKAATDYTLTVEYYRRLPLLGDLLTDTEKLDISQEAQAALVYGAQKRLAIHIHGPEHPDVAVLDKLENRALDRLIAIDRHHPDSNTRFRLADRSRGSGRSGPGRFYIEI